MVHSFDLAKQKAVRQESSSRGAMAALIIVNQYQSIQQG
jgi:hypothetical protein